MPYHCSVCHLDHEGPAFVWGPPAPDPYLALSESARANAEINTDQCVLTQPQRTFVLGRLEIPVHHTDELFARLVWVELDHKSFLHMTEQWDQIDRASNPPYPATLANDLPIYEVPTLGLAVRVHTRPPGNRPFLEVTTPHQLALEQAHGISRARVERIDHLLSQ